MAKRGLILKRKQPKISKAAMTLVDKNRMGPEPTWGGLPTENQMGKYYNWMNYFFTPSDKRDDLVSYLESSKEHSDAIAAVKRVPNQFFVARSSVVWNARALNRGLELDTVTLTRFRMKLAAFITDAMALRSDWLDKPVERNTTPVIERVKNKANEVKGEIDALIDKNSDFGTIHDISGLTSAVAKHIVALYQVELDEIDTAITGKDAEIAEGYSGYSRPALKALGNYYSQVVSKLTQIASVEKPRAVRSRKIKTPAELAKKVKFQVSAPDLNLTSVNPAFIVGSNELWVYHTKTRKLGVYRASDPSGLTIKGTTVLGADEASSIAKKLRKPEVTLPEIVTGGKVAVRRAFESVKSVPAPLSGRINGETILLRVFK